MERSPDASSRPAERAAPLLPGAVGAVRYERESTAHAERDHDPIGALQLDREGRCVSADDPACAMLGAAREALIGRTIAELLGPDVLPRDHALHALHARLAAGEGPGYRLEARQVGRNGATRWIRATVTAVPTAPSAAAAECFLAVIENVSAERAAMARLRDASTRYRRLVDSDIVGVAVADEAGVREANDEFLRLAGTTREAFEAHGIDWQAITPPEHLEKDRRGLQEILTRGACTPFEKEYRWPDGRRVPILVGGALLQHEPLRWIAFALDLTDRHEAERALREREAEFRTLANAIPQMAWIADRDGRRSWFNDRWYEFSGLTLDQSRDLGWRQLVHPDHRARMVAGQRAAFARGEVWEDTYPLRRRDGVYRWFLTRAVPIAGDGTGAVRWLGTNTDITDRLEAEQAVRASEAKLRRIAESGLIGICYWTGAGPITDANDAFCRMLGVSPGDVRAGALDWHPLTPREWHDTDRAKERELAAHGVVTPWEKELYARDGRRIPVLVGSARLDDTTDRRVAVCLDISRLKEADRERERLLALERDAHTAAERALRLRDDVLGIVAHDLRNPVHTVAMSVATLLEIPLPEAQRTRHLGIIRRAAREMSRLISDLLDVTHIESGTLAMRHAGVPVAPLLDEMVEQFASQAEARGLSLHCAPAADLPPVWGDRDRLVQVLSNLLGNALKFTDAGGRIALHARRVGGWVRISVEDSGRGIPPASLPHVFDRFWQAERTSRAGAGLGLAIALGIVRAHGGEMAVESVEGRGSTFHLTLPVADVADG